MNAPPSHFSLAEKTEDQHLKLSFVSPLQASSYVSSPTFIFTSCKDQSSTNDSRDSWQDQKGDDDHKPIRNKAPNNQLPSSVEPVVDVSTGNNSNNNETTATGSGSSSVKWMSSKMRLMKKMMNDPDYPSASSDKGERINHMQQKNNGHQSYNNSSSNSVRVCSDCSTTTTPLWRSGPRGPKSLCNACGIRQRKARRAMAEAAAAANGSIVISDTNTNAIKTTKMLHKEKKSRAAHLSQYRNKYNKTQKSNELCFSSDLSFAALNDEYSAAFHGVFPQDVAEAAILLMELSCGFVHS
ncbi:hypothetical protein UlMin_045184 [Ulmus minor]